MNTAVNTELCTEHWTLLESQLSDPSQCGARGGEWPWPWPAPPAPGGTTSTRQELSRGGSTDWMTSKYDLLRCWHNWKFWHFLTYFIIPCNYPPTWMSDQNWLSDRPSTRAAKTSQKSGKLILFTVSWTGRTVTLTCPVCWELSNYHTTFWCWK